MGVIPRWTMIGNCRALSPCGNTPASVAKFLGEDERRLYELIWMYTMFPGRGFNVKPQLISRIEDRNGNVLMAVGPQISEVISEVTAYTMCKMMGGAVRFGTATRMNSYGIKLPAFW